MIEDLLSDNQMIKGTHLSMVFFIFAINLDIKQRNLEKNESKCFTLYQSMLYMHKKFGHRASECRSQMMN